MLLSRLCSTMVSVGSGIEWLRLADVSVDKPHFRKLMTYKVYLKESKQSWSNISVPSSMHQYLDKGIKSAAIVYQIFQEAESALPFSPQTHMQLVHARSAANHH